MNESYYANKVLLTSNIGYPFPGVRSGWVALGQQSLGDFALIICRMACMHATNAPLLQWDPDDVDLDGTGVPSHRVEVRISDPNTQCDKSKPGHKDRTWMAGMQHERNYLGLLEFGQMEAQGFLDIAGYEFVYQDHAVAFTDEFSTACEPPVLVFFDAANEVVDTVDPKGLSMTSIVKELAVCFALLPIHCVRLMKICRW